MENPIKSSFDWSTLYNKYDDTCRRFDLNAPYLESFPERPQNDRYLYYMLVGRVKDEWSEEGHISLNTYEAILYWKLYSQPAATKNICHKIHRDTHIQKTLQIAIKGLCQQLPPTVIKDISHIKELYDSIEQYGKILYGLSNSCALPARSTLLHFFYPDTVPIFDKQVLRAVGVDGKDANKKYDILFQYIEFAWDISNNPSLIPQDWQETPLRLLDMALWVLRGKH